MNHSGSSFILHPSSFPGRYTFCCTFPVLADGGRYPPPCPVEPGLSSPRRTNMCSEATPAAYRAATVRPTCRLFLIIDDPSSAKGSHQPEAPARADLADASGWCEPRHAGVGLFRCRLVG